MVNIYLLFVENISALKLGHIVSHFKLESLFIPLTSFSKVHFSFSYVNNTQHQSFLVTVFHCVSNTCNTVGNRLCYICYGFIL